MQDHVDFCDSTSVSLLKRDRSLRPFCCSFPFLREYPDNYIANGDGLAARTDFLHSEEPAERQPAVVSQY